MAYIFITFDALLVLFTLVDTFLTVLNYNQRGLLFNRAIRWQWSVVHFLCRPLKCRMRKKIYRAMTGMNLAFGISLWVFGIVFGFALIYYGAGMLALVHTPTRSAPGLLDSLYFSVAQFSTVGGSGLTANSELLGVFTVIETLLSVVLLSMVVTYLVNIFNSIEALRTYCACFFSSSSAVTSPLSDLAHFLPSAGSFSLEAHLISTRQSMNGYFDSIASDHSAAYFYSGKDRFIMPFAVFMTAGTVEALRFGAKTDAGIGQLAELPRLSESFCGSRQQIYKLFHWPDPPPPSRRTRKTLVAWPPGQQNHRRPIPRKMSPAT